MIEMEWYTNKNYACLTLDIYHRHVIPGGRSYEQPNGEWVDVPYGQEPPVFARIPVAELSNFLKALSEVDGVDHPRLDFVEGKNEAQSEHLKDMREIAFGLLKIKRPT